MRVDLPPIDHASGAVDAVRAIIEAVATGQIAPNEGSALATLVATYARTINDAKVELRLDDIEKRQKEIQDALEDLKIR